MKGKHRFHPIECTSTLVLLETLIFIKIVSVSVTVSNTTTGPDSKLKLTAIGILKDYCLWFETINLGRSIVNIKGSQINISFSEYLLCP